MNNIELKSFDEIYKIIHPYNNGYFSDNSREIYFGFYELLTNIDFSQMCVSVIYDIDGFLPLMLNRRAESILVVPFDNLDLLTSNIQLYYEQNNSNKRINLFIKDNDTSKFNLDVYRRYFDIQTDYNSVLRSDFAFLIMSQDIQDLSTLKTIVKHMVKCEGILFILSIEGHSKEIISSIQENTFLKHAQSFVLHPTKTITLEFTIMSIPKSELPFQLELDLNKKIETKNYKIPKIGQKDQKKKTLRILNSYLNIFSDTVHFAQQTQHNVHAYIFLPLFSFKFDNKSIKLMRKRSILNNLIINDDKNSNLFDFNWTYEIKTNDKNFFHDLKNASRAFIKECAISTSFNDINFDAQLITLPGYGTINEPLDIPVSIKLTSEGIFIYSSSPFYHVVFADYWDINSYASPFPYIKCDRKFKKYRSQLAFVFTKGSRESLIEEDFEDSNEIEIGKELGILFDCEMGSTQDQPTESQNSESDEINKKDQIEQNKEKDKNEKSKDKDKKSKDKDENPKEKDKKSKDKNKSPKEKDKDKKEKPKDKEKNDQSKDKNEKQEENDQNGDKKTETPETINDKLKQNKAEKPTDFLMKPVGCISLRFQDPTEFISIANKAISFCLSSKVKKKTEKLMNKLYVQKKTEEVDKEKIQKSES